MTLVLFHSSAGSCEATTSFSVSLKNVAPSSSSVVRSRQAGANISWVRPAEQDRLGVGADRTDRLAHLRVETEFEGPGG